MLPNIDFRAVFKIDDIFNLMFFLLKLRFPFKEWDGSSSIVLNPSLEYLAPEYGLNSKCDLSSDMFSYGMLFYTVYNGGKTLYKCNSNYSIFINNVEDVISI